MPSQSRNRQDTYLYTLCASWTSFLTCSRNSRWWSCFVVWCEEKSSLYPRESTPMKGGVFRPLQTSSCLRVLDSWSLLGTVCHALFVSCGSGISIRILLTIEFSLPMFGGQIWKNLCWSILRIGEKLQENSDMRGKIDFGVQSTIEKPKCQKEEDPCNQQKEFGAQNKGLSGSFTYVLS